MRKKKLINQLKDDICDLENEIEGLKAQISYLKIENASKQTLQEEQIFNMYDYVILVDNYKTKLIYKGQKQDNIREISFEHIEKEIPELTIRR